MEEIEQIDEPNEIIVEKVEGNSLVKEITYDEIPIRREVIDINEINKKLEKIDSAIEQWNSKRKPLQDILDRFNELSD